LPLLPTHHQSYCKDAESMLDDAERELLDLTVGIDMEEMVTVTEVGAGDKDDEENDNVEGWVDEMALLSDKKVSGTSQKVGPVQLVLVKVSKS
jgi:hypothetical protein